MNQYAIYLITAIAVVIGAWILFRNQKKHVIAFMGSSSYWFKTLGISQKVINVNEAINLTNTWINEAIVSNNSVSLTDLANASYCLEIFKRVKNIGFNNVYSNRGTDKVKTTLLGHLKRIMGKNVADAGTGEIKCVNGEVFNMDDKNALHHQNNQELAAFLKKNEITEIFATGNWRNLSIQEVEHLSDCFNVVITILSQDKEQEMEKEAFIGAMKILAPNIQVDGIHAHGNGSTQGDILKNNFGLKKIKKYIESAITSKFWDNVIITGEGKKQTVIFNKDLNVNEKDYIRSAIGSYILMNIL
jgi:hypothetical protein